MSLEHGDLKRLVHDELHVDEYESKLGDNRDVVVVSLKVGGKEPALDICGFVEKGYDWVLDADTSSGEMDDGDYLVFIELPRDRDSVQHIIEMMEDLMNLTEQNLSDWRFNYYKEYDIQKFDKETLERLIPQSPEDYDQRYGRKEIDSLKTAAGVKVNTKAPKNAHTESLRIAAGII
jgi:hypothetical protein